MLTGWIKPFEKSTYENSFNKSNQIWGDLNLEKYNKEVLNLLNSPITEFDPNIILKLNYSLPQLNMDFLTLHMHGLPPLRIKNFWKERLIRNNNFDKINKYNDVIVGYKLLDYKKNKNKIETLIFRNKDNDEIIVKADFFIFCMGGIEMLDLLKEFLKIQDKK